MSSAPPPRPAGPRGPQKKLESIDVPTSNATKYVPYVLVGAVLLGLLATILYAPAWAVPAAMALLTVAALGLGYAGFQDTHGLPPDDSFRKVVGGGTAAVVLGLVALVALTLYPPTPFGTVTLQRAGDSGTVRVDRDTPLLFLDTHGTFEPDVGPSVQAQYTLHLTREGTEEEVSGAFERSAGQSPVAGGNMAASATTEATAARHALTTLHGAGTYTITLDRLPDSLRPPLRASLRSALLAPWMVYGLLGLLALVVVVIDAGLSKRGIEPTYAASLLLPIAFTAYLSQHFSEGNVGQSLFTAFLIGLLVGGLGGEGLARVTRKALG